MNLSEHFTKEEFQHSDKADECGIVNEMDVAQMTAAIVLCETVLEPLREHLDRPIHISSGFRCPKLNMRVGGAATSQHTKGQAVDITVPGTAPQEVFDVIKKNIPYDQVIQENNEWVHVSYRENPRFEALKATRNSAGRMIYESVL